MSSSSTTATATISDDLIGSYKIQENTYTTASNERINPFDKNNKSVEKTAAIGYGQSVPSVISAPAAPPPATKTTTTTAKLIEDTTKNQYDAYKSSTIGSAPIPIALTTSATSSYYSSTVSVAPIIESVKDKKYTSSYSTEKDHPSISSPAVLPDSASSKRSDASKYSFGSNQYRSSGSMSDADIIFGEEFGGAVRTDSIDKSRATPGLGSSTKNKFSRDGSNFNTSVDSSDSIFGGSDTKRDTYYTNRSMSVSSAKDVDYIYQPSDSATATTTSTYRVYEGIQNAAFSDFDSPSRSSVSSTTSATAGGTNTAIKKRSTYADDDDYDLK